MKSPSIDNVRDVIRRLSGDTEMEESVLRDDSGTEVAYRVRSGEFIALWNVTTHTFRIYGVDARPIAGLV